MENNGVEFNNEPAKDPYDQLADYFMSIVANHEMEFQVVGILLMRCKRFEAMLNWFCDELEVGNMSYEKAYAAFCEVLDRDNLMVAPKNDLPL